MDLRKQRDTKIFFEKKDLNMLLSQQRKLEAFLQNSSFPAHFLYDNLLIQNNLIHYSYEYNVSKLLFLGSACIYPKYAVQPIKGERTFKWKVRTNK